LFTEPPERLLCGLNLSVIWDGDAKGDFAAKTLLTTLLPLDIKPAECAEIDIQTNKEMISIQIVRRNVECKTSVY